MCGTKSNCFSVTKCSRLLLRTRAAASIHHLIGRCSAVSSAAAASSLIEPSSPVRNTAPVLSPFELMGFGWAAAAGDRRAASSGESEFGSVPPSSAGRGACLCSVRCSEDVLLLTRSPRPRRWLWRSPPPAPRSRRAPHRTLLPLRPWLLCVCAAETSVVAGSAWRQPGGSFNMSNRSK